MRKNHFSSGARQNERPVPFSGRRKASARVGRSAVSCSPEKRAKDKREPMWLKPFCLKHCLFFGFLRCWPSFFLTFWTVRENDRTSDCCHDDATSQRRTPNGCEMCAGHGLQQRNVHSRNRSSISHRVSLGSTSGADRLRRSRREPNTCLFTQTRRCQGHECEWRS